MAEIPKLELNTERIRRRAGRGVVARPLYSLNFGETGDGAPPDVNALIRAYDLYPHAFEEDGPRPRHFPNRVREGSSVGCSLPGQTLRLLGAIDKREVEGYFLK